MARMRHFLKRCPAVLLSAALLAAAVGTAAAADTPAPTLGIYTTGDMGGRLYREDPVTGEAVEYSYQNVASAMEAERASVDAALLLDSGDAVDNGLVQDGGAAEALALRAIGYDALVPAVGEFRLGPEAGTISSPPWVKRRRTAPRCASSRATTWTRTPKARRRMPTRSLLWSWAGARCASACWAWAPWRRRRSSPSPLSPACALPTGTTPPAAIVGSGPATGRSGWKRRTATWWWWSATPDRTNWPALLRRPPASTCWWAAMARRRRRPSRTPTGSRSPWSAAAARP